DYTQEGKPIFVAGSHNTRRKEFDKNKNRCLYWKPYEWYPQIKNMIKCLYAISHKPIIVFGEIYGSGVQDLTYGMENGVKDFRVFDISDGGTYLPWKTVNGYCYKFDIPTVPQLYKGPFSKNLIEEYTNGDSVLSHNDKFQGREGIVITPLEERKDWQIGRVILKSISVDYLNR
ncbi:hypothetical protein LCGC14_2218180, partial [marine sediment metagenome]